tara:strand:- start:3065 stop:4189 length:1125 start_codon:yes stop_codon:yes gene_type:complete
MSQELPGPEEPPSPEGQAPGGPASEEASPEEAVSEGEAPPGRGIAAKLISLGVSLLVLLALYQLIEWRQVPGVLANSNPLYLGLALFSMIPITLGVAARFLWIAPKGSVPSLWEALRLTLVAQVLNLFLPAKLGDLGKSYFIAKSGEVSPGLAVSVVVYERGCDLFGLLTWCVVGLALELPQLGGLTRWGVLFVAAAWLGTGLMISSQRIAAWIVAIAVRILPGRASRAVAGLGAGWALLHSDLAQRRGQRALIALASVGLWFMHLTQIWLFVLTVGGEVPLLTSFAFSALAILCALVPFGFAGIGVRDAAFVALYTSMIGAEKSATVGLLSATRPLLPALAALAVVRSSVVTAISQARTWRRELGDSSKRGAE